MKFYTLLVIAILVLSAAFRVGYPDLAEFGMDEDSGACYVFNLVNSHKPPLFIGATHGGMFTFSIMNVLFYIVFLFAHDPRLIILLSIGIPNTIAVILLFLFCVKFIGKREALIATALFGFSNWSIVYSKSLWGVCALQFFIMLFFYLLTLSMHRDKSKLMIFPILLLPILPSLHLTSISVFVTVFLVFLICYKRLNWKYLFIMGVILIIPILVFMFTRKGWGSGLTFGGSILTANFTLKAIHTSLGLLDRYPWFYCHLGFNPRYLTLEIINGMFIKMIFLFGLTYILRKIIQDWRRRGFSPYIIIGLWFFVYVITMGFTNLKCYGHYFMVVLPVIFVIASLGFISLVDNFSGRDKIKQWEFLILFIFFMLWNPWVTLLGVLVIGLLNQLRFITLAKKSMVPLLYSSLIFIIAFQALSNFQLYGDISKKGGGTGRYGITLGAKIKAVKYIIDDAEVKYSQFGLRSSCNDYCYSYLFKYLMAEKEKFISSDKKNSYFHYIIVEDVDRSYTIEKSPRYIHHKRMGPIVIIVERTYET